jgi:RND family efflux transporter MFP subunit
MSAETNVRGQGQAIAFGVSVAMLAMAACHGGADAGGDDEDKAAPAAVTCEPAAAADVAQTVDVSGVIAPPPKLDAIVSSSIAGRVAQVAVEAGDRVIAGAPLAMIEDPALPAGSLEAKAAVNSAQAAKAAADQELARQQRLVDTGIGARRDLDDARAKATAASAELDAANARAGLANTQLARREVRAPRAGTILHVWKRVGESVDGTTATAIAEIADLSVLELHAQVPPAGLVQLREGMAATAHMLGVNDEVHATVVRVAPAVDATTLLGLVRLRLDSSGPLEVGTAASARIVVASTRGVVVPASALRRSLVGADEVVVCDGTTARIREVKVGERDDHGVQLEDGVKPGERIVVDHVLGLVDGQPLVPPTATAPAAKPPGAGRPK